MWYIAIVLVTQWQIASLHLALSQSVLDENGLPNIRDKQASHSGGKFGLISSHGKRPFILFGYKS